MAKPKIYVGTSGWMYKPWGKVFYPNDVKGKDQLPYLAKEFATVEINNTFYRIPTNAAVEGWRKTTPKNFVFAVKINNYFTHSKKLVLDEKSIERLKFFFERVSPLKPKMAALLIQLQPSFRSNSERLDNFLTCVEKQIKTKRTDVCCEFRHASWFTDETYDILRKHEAGFVIATYPRTFKPPYPITSEAVYIRLHATPQKPNYTDKQLDKCADYISSLGGDVKRIYVYFNNDFEGWAIFNARYLKQALSKRSV
jgi:uncharacterized protein YecE (DUF72 family)